MQRCPVRDRSGTVYFQNTRNTRDRRHHGGPQALDPHGARPRCSPPKAGCSSQVRVPLSLQEGVGAAHARQGCALSSGGCLPQVHRGKHKEQGLEDDHGVQGVLLGPTGHTCTRGQCTCVHTWTRIPREVHHGNNTRTAQAPLTPWNSQSINTSSCRAKGTRTHMTCCAWVVGCVARWRSRRVAGWVGGSSARWAVPGWLGG